MCLSPRTCQICSYDACTALQKVIAQRQQLSTVVPIQPLPQPCKSLLLLPLLLNKHCLMNNESAQATIAQHFTLNVPVIFVATMRALHSENS
jgi:hypothetical protein